MTKAGSGQVRAPAGDAGRYRIFGTIGSGGMGSVHIGRLSSSADFMRTVAIKRPLPELLRDAEARAHIRREARVASRIHHPNVVATLDVAEEGEELWVVMEYVHGPSLAALLALAREREQQIPIAVSLALVTDALRGLEAVHSARDEAGEPLGIIHRDLSPHNILCSMDGTARIADFGLARAEALTSISRSVRFKGKLAYASPEQADLKPLTRASDLYSVGVVLWELLSGRRLYHGTTPTEVLAQVLAASVPAPSTLNPKVTPALDALVLRALARDPAQRFASALELQTALKSAAALAPVEAVAQWLREFAGELMLERDALLREAESGAARGQEIASSGATLLASSVGGNDPTWPQPSSERFSRQLSPRRRDMRRGLASIIIETARSRLALSLLSVAVGASLALFATDAFLSRSEPEPPRGAERPAPAASAAPQSVGTASAALQPAASPVALDTELQPAPRVEAAGSGPSLPPSGVGDERHVPVAPPAPRASEAKGAPPRAAPRAAQAACDPPYSIDAEGIRHMRPGCE